MNYQDKTKEELTNELQELRQKYNSLKQLFDTGSTQQEHVKQELTDSENQFKILFNAIDEGFCIIELIFDENEKPVDYRFLQINKSFEKQTGLIDATGKLMRELAPEHEDHWFEIYGNVAVTGQPIRFENQAEQLNRWYTVYAFRHGQPENRQVAVLFKDITERKKVEKELELERTKLTAAFENDSVGLVICNAQGGDITMNATALRFHEFSSIQEMQEKMKENENDWELYDMNGELLPFSEWPIRRAIRGEYLRDLEFHYHNLKTGTNWTCNLTVMPVHSKNGEVSHIVQTMLDVTRKKQAEEALRKSEGRFRNLIKSIPDSFVVENANHQFIYWNKKTEEITGLPAAQVFGKTRLELMGDNETTIRTNSIILECIKSKKPIQFEINREFKGKENTYEIRVFPTEEGGVSLIGRDVTELKQTETLKLAKQKAEDAERNYRLIFESTGTANSIFDIDCNLIMYNKLSEEFLGKGENGGIGLSAVEVFGEKTGKIVFERMKRVISTGIPEVFETEFKLTTGTNWFRSTYQPVFDENRKVISIQVISQNITEIKIAEQELIIAKEKSEENEKKFRRLVWDMQVGVLLQGAKAEMLLCNPAALELLGLTDDQLMGKSSFDPYWNVIHEDGSPFPGTTHPVPVAIETRKPVRSVVMGVYRPATNDRVWLLVDAIPQLSDNGTVQQVVCTFINISKKKQAEFLLKEKNNEIEAQNEELTQTNEELLNAKDSLEESNKLKDELLAKFNETQKIAQIGSWDWDIITNRVWWSKETYHLFELQPEEFVPDFKNNVSYVCPEDLDNYYKIFENCVQTGDLLNHDFKIKTASDKIKYCNVQGKILYENDKPVRFIGTIMDITLRKEIENTLATKNEEILKAKEKTEKSEKHLQLITNNLPILICHCDRDFNYLFANTMFEEIFGYKPKDIIGKNITEILGKEALELAIPNYQKVLTGEYVSFEKIVINKNRQKRYFQTSYIPQNEKNKVSGFFVLAWDITERKETEIIIQQQNHELKKLNADKDRFIAILAHDLKNPFDSLLGFSSLLLKNIRIYDLDKIEKQIQIINKTAQYTYDLLLDILLWARIQAGKIPFQPQKVSFIETCDGIVNSLKIIADEKNICLNYFESDSIEILADVNMFKTILRNLITNALKFTKPDGKIDIYAEKEQNNIIIAVADNGIGIAQEKLKNLFDFSQLLTSDGTSGEKGTGLGLQLCKEFVEKHGGKIWVESKPEKGTIFFFTLKQFEN